MQDTITLEPLVKQLEGCMSSEGLALDLEGGGIEGSILNGQSFNYGPLTMSNGTIRVDVLRNLTNTVLKNVRIMAPDNGEVVVLDCSLKLYNCVIRGSPLVVCGTSKIEMVDCQVEKSSRHGLVLHSGEGSELMAVNCKFSGNQQSGLYVSAMFRGEKRSLFNLPYSNDSEFCPGRLSAVNCQFDDNEEFGAVVMGSAVATFTQCNFQGSIQRSGLWCGATTHVSLSNSVFMGNKENGIYMHGGGSIAFIKGCSFKGAREYHGLIIEGRGTSVTVSGSDFVSNQKSGIKVSGGASITIEACMSFNSRGFGIILRGQGTRARATKSKFHSNRKSNAIVQRGAAAIFEACSFENAKEHDGIQVLDHSTRVTATQCDFSGNRNDGGCISGGANAEFAQCTFRDSVAHHGLEILGKGTDVSVGNSMFAGNHQSGVFVHGKAFLVMDGCTSQGSLTMHGVEVCEEGTHASIAHCQILGNCENGILVQQGAMVHLNSCKCMYSAMMHGLEVRDFGTKVMGESWLMDIKMVLRLG